jgi:hypothetical protein
MDPTREQIDRTPRGGGHRTRRGSASVDRPARAQRRHGMRPPGWMEMVAAIGLMLALAAIAPI